MLELTCFDVFVSSGFEVGPPWCKEAVLDDPQRVTHETHLVTASYRSSVLKQSHLYWHLQLLWKEVFVCCSGLSLQYLDVLVGVYMVLWIFSLNIIILNVFNDMRSYVVFFKIILKFLSNVSETNKLCDVKVY